jgi:hypothetical protein
VPPASGPGLRPLIWWILWAALLTGYLQVCYFARSVRPGPPSTVAAVVGVMVGLGFLLLSAAIRWLLLPRISRVGVAFVFFLAGQALAEGCGYVGVFLGGSYSGPLAAGGTLGLLQFMPLFLGRYRAADPAARRRGPP